MSGYIYFVAVEGGDAIKIGYTASEPRKRLSNLQTGCDRMLYLVAYGAGTKADERNIHVALSHLRVRQSGEWFRYEGDLQSILDKLTWLEYDEHLDFEFDGPPRYEDLTWCADWNGPVSVSAAFFASTVTQPMAAKYRAMLEAA